MPSTKMSQDRRVKVGIAVLLLNHKGDLLLGKRLNAHGAGTWAPPGGCLEYGESFEGCARRELLEETGIDMPVDAFTCLRVQNDIFQKEEKYFVTVFMKASLQGAQIPQDLEPHKCEGWKWFALDELSAPLFRPFDKFVTLNGMKCL